MHRIARVVRAGLVGFVGIVAFEHLVRRDLPPGEHFVSEYAQGWTHPLQAAAFVSWAAATAACAALAARVHRRRGARAVVVVALAVATAGLCLAAIFATQTVAGELPLGTRRTTGGRLHDFGTLLILAGL